MSESKINTDLNQEIELLRQQLQDTQETLLAIRTGQVDAIVVENDKGHQLYTLKSADQTYRVFIEKMKEGAVTLNQEEIILYSNSQFASMVNVPLTKVIGRKFSDFLPEESLEGFKELIREGWKSDSKGEIQLRNTSGELVPFLISFTALELDEGDSLSIILTDLSAHKRIEKELKIKNEQLEDARIKASKMNEELEAMVEERTRDLVVSREHFKFLAENTPVMIWTTGPDGKVDYFNKQWYDYTGFNFEESITKLHELIPEGEYEKGLIAWQKAVDKKERFEYETKFKRAYDGSYRWHRTLGIPVKDEQGELIAWFGTSIDIEDQKKELEKKDEFISVASHELKTPLTSLKGYMQLIKDHEPELPPTVNQYLRKAHDSLNKIQHLINDLLDVSKIQAGKLSFNTEIIDLSELLESGIETSIHIYPHFKIVKSIPPEIYVRGNAERLEQVLMNLISNAIKYSWEEKEIGVKAELSENEVTVSVSDRGIGLTNENQKRIFERFFRVEDNLNHTPGLGMGLYISSEIIKEHQGRMNVKSNLRKGSTFSFTLPLVTNPK